MPATTHEATINDALGEVLQELRRTSWRIRSEELKTLVGSSKRPDILIEEPAGWPVVIEAERSSRRSAEQDALARLGQTVNETGRPIESAIALVYPPSLHGLSGEALRGAIREAADFEYALYTANAGGGHERLPESGWLQGGVLNLAMLAARASTPAPRVERLAQILEDGVTAAAGAFDRKHESHRSGVGPAIAQRLGQADDLGDQTRRMAMTVLINALIFHEALAESDFRIEREASLDGLGRRAAPLSKFRSQLDLFMISKLLAEWDQILEVNYWPIFATAKAILNELPMATAAAVLAPLWDAAEMLVQGGVTRSHDLTGTIVQRLIADRKFLATFYTRPAAAALLAGLAIPAEHAPGGAEWGDESVAALQIGDFACGTGTLLAAAYQRISMLHELHGGDPKQLHRELMKNGLHGLDVLNIAVHLTAAMLAGAHPDVPFEGECLLTMPYGKQEDGSVAIGSLDLLAEQIQPSLISQAAAATAGGRAPEEVTDLVNRVGHGQFDLVIMNPPFTRAVGQEAKKKGTGNPAFAGLNTPPSVQKEMTRHLRGRREGPPLASGNAGLSADFVDLAQRKVNANGCVALVLPLSAVSGAPWDNVRTEIARRFEDLTVITIAAPRPGNTAFSADTGIAECLLIGSGTISPEPRAQSPEPRACFVVLGSSPPNTPTAELIAECINHEVQIGQVRRLEDDPVGGTPLEIGGQRVGYLLDCPIPKTGPWPVVGIADASLAQAAYQLQHGRLSIPGMNPSDRRGISIALIGEIAGRGPYHADISWSNADGTPRGPFEIISPPAAATPTIPVVWGSNAKRERQLIITPDSEAQLKHVHPNSRDALAEKAESVIASATRAHYNRDVGFSAQSLIAAMTERKTIGGRAWPSVIFENPDHEYSFTLWCNSTLGMLMHWWVTNKTQSGRGLTSVTAIPNIPTLDTRTLSDQQHAAAKAAFERLSGERFLPFDQIDEDPARAKLDRAILVDVLGLPESLAAEGGPLELLRRKLAREPQIHGGKRSRVVFTDEGEISRKRSDR